MKPGVLTGWIKELTLHISHESVRLIEGAYNNKPTQHWTRLFTSHKAKRRWQIHILFCVTFLPHLSCHFNSARQRNKEERTGRHFEFTPLFFATWQTHICETTIRCIVYIMAACIIEVWSYNHVFRLDQNLQTKSASRAPGSLQAQLSTHLFPISSS